MNVLETKIKELINKPIINLGFYLIDVRYIKESGEFFLRIIIDKDGDISLDDIVKVNENISPILDQADLIKEKYMLDIISLGAEKEIHINHLDKYINKYVNLHLSHPYQGLNNLIGYLVMVDENKATIEIMDKSRKKKIEIERKYIDKANLAIKF